MTSVDSPFILNMLCAWINGTTPYCGLCSFSEPGAMWPAQSPLKRVNGAVRRSVGGDETLTGMMHKISAAAAKSFGVLHRLRDPQAGASLTVPARV